MYNSEIKKRYISEKESGIRINPYIMPALFEKTAAYEEAAGKDVCNFSASQAAEMLNAFGSHSINSVNVNVSMLKQYTDWCIQQGIAARPQNPYKGISADLAFRREYYEKRVWSREQVLACCRDLPDFCDRFILLGLFEGIKGKNYCEFTMMKRADIDSARRTIGLYGRGPCIFSEELCRLGIKSADEYYYHTLSGDRSIPFPPDDDHVIKAQRNAMERADLFRKGRRVYTALNRIFRFIGADPDMNAQTVAESGMIDMIKRRSRENGMSAQAYLYSSSFSEVEKQYDTHIVKAHFIKKYGGLLTP